MSLASPLPALSYCPSYPQWQRFTYGCLALTFIFSVIRLCQFQWEDCLPLTIIKSVQKLSFRNFQSNWHCRIILNQDHFLKIYFYCVTKVSASGGMENKTKQKWVLLHRKPECQCSGPPHCDARVCLSSALRAPSLSTPCLFPSSCTPGCSHFTLFLFDQVSGRAYALVASWEKEQEDERFNVLHIAGLISQLHSQVSSNFSLQIIFTKNLMIWLNHLLASNILLRSWMSFLFPKLILWYLFILSMNTLSFLYPQCSKISWVSHTLCLSVLVTFSNYSIGNFLSNVLYSLYSAIIPLDWILFKFLLIFFPPIGHVSFGSPCWLCRLGWEQNQPSHRISTNCPVSSPCFTPPSTVYVVPVPKTKQISRV